MRCRRSIASVCAVLAAVILLEPAAALAACPGSSASNSQYVDPLACQTVPSSTTSQRRATGSARSGPAPSTPAPSSSTSAAQATAQTTATGSSGPVQPSRSADSSPAQTLPMTGLNVPAAVAFGIAMLGTGVLLRRAARGT